MNKEAGQYTRNMFINSNICLMLFNEEICCFLTGKFSSLKIELWEQFVNKQVSLCEYAIPVYQQLQELVTVNSSRLPGE